MIVFDTETTGFYKPELTTYEGQAEMVEFAAIKLDDRTLEEKASLEFRCKPQNEVPPDAIDIHGITNEALQNEKPFGAYYKDLCNFFLGEQILIAHNINFDKNILRCELGRIGLITSFPWTCKNICTSKKMNSYCGGFITLSQFYCLSTGKEKIEGAHSAIVDVEALIVCIKWLKSELGADRFNELFLIG